MKVRYIIPVLSLLAVSCTMQARLTKKSPSAGLHQPKKERTVTTPDAPPPLKVEYKGDSVFLVETVGEDTIPTIQAATVNVVSEVRNVAERGGKLTLSFVITVPKCLQGTVREILLYPTLHAPGSTTFAPICLRGRTMDILQQREYWQLYRHQKLFHSTGGYLLFPYTDDARVDSVTHGKKNAEFLCTETISSENMPRRLRLTVQGKVVSIDGTEYTIPERDTVGYVISSMTEFLDTTTRHRIKIIDRNVAVEAMSRITFLPGKHNLIDTLGNNRAEFAAITDLQKKVRELPDLELDSITVTATASPEGSFRNNARLSRLRGEAVADSLFQEFRPIVKTLPENWADLEDSIRSMKLERLLETINREKDPDKREEVLRNRFPQEYVLLRKKVYPALRMVSVRYYMHRIGMEKDTLHLQEVDTIYMNAVDDLRQRRYSKALEVLSAYRDRNTAIALMSLGYDRQAMEIISRENESDTREYLLAILCSRLGMDEKARQHYLNSCRLNGLMEFRGNLDPEINKILNR